MGRVIPRSVGASVTDVPVTAGHGWPTLLLVGMELVLAAGALGGAWLMFTEGDAAFDATVTAEQLPLHSWTIASAALVVIAAALPAAVALAAWLREPWARVGHFVVAGALVAWILIEVAVLGWISWLQPALLVYATAIAVVATRVRHT